MKSPMLQIFDTDKEDFLQWWRRRSFFEKIIFGIYGLFELFILLIIILEGLDYLDIIE
tara:strand:- start:910 stop:1083 length:174 start_codon:yes stop_codon:yes gene_type:complete